jgi:hypothetical protein
MSTQADKLKAVVEQLAALIGGHEVKTPVDTEFSSSSEKAASPSYRTNASRTTKPSHRKVFVAKSQSLIPEEIIPLEKADLKDF